MSHVNDVQRLVNAGLLVKGKSGVHLGRNLARDNLQDLTAELHEQAVEGSVHLLVEVLAVVLAVGDGIVNELRVVGLFRRGEDQGRVGGGILRLVLADRGEVAGVADDGLYVEKGDVWLAAVDNQSPTASFSRRRRRLTVPAAFNWSRDEVMIVVL